MKKQIIASRLKSGAEKKLMDMGYEIIEFPDNPNADIKVAHHSDLSFFVCDNIIFIAREMSQLRQKFEDLGYTVYILPQNLNKNYPEDVKLNCAVVGNYLICNVDTVSTVVLKYFRNSGKTILNVNQGYTKCAVIPVADNAVITDDESICRKCTEYGLDVLKVSKGNVILDGYDYGFIGGTAGKINNDTIAFNGDILTHPDGEKIIDFIKKHGMHSLSLSDGMLVDIGSIITL